MKTLIAEDDFTCRLLLQEILCDAYLAKPIQKAKLLEELRKLGLIQ